MLHRPKDRRKDLLFAKYSWIDQLSLWKMLDQRMAVALFQKQTRIPSTRTGCNRRQCFLGEVSSLDSNAVSLNKETVLKQPEY